MARAREELPVRRKLRAGQKDEEEGSAPDVLEGGLRPDVQTWADSRRWKKRAW